jgi:anti-sigma factor RsiW
MMASARRPVLVMPPRCSIRAEAESLGKLGEHIAELQAMYERRALALARRALGGAPLPAKPEIVDAKDGFAIHFSWPQRRR